MNPNLLIVDDEKPTRDGLRAALEDRYEVYVAEDAASAANLLEAESFEVLLTDCRLPNNEDGMKLIARAKSLAKPPICILMTAYGSEELAVEALKQGADDYLAKGRMQIDELETRIARALKLRTLESENKTLKQQLNKKFGLENIIGESEPMQKVMDIVRQVAPSRATVLLQGESGSGKSVPALSVMGLLPMPPGIRAGGQILCSPGAAPPRAPVASTAQRVLVPSASTTASWNEAATSAVAASGLERTWLTTAVLRPLNEKA